MPKHPAVDWQLAQVLWAAGEPPKTIAAQLGCKIWTLYSRAKRGGWSAMRTKVEEVVASQAAPKQDLQSIAAQLRDTMARDALNTSQALERLPVDRLPLDQLETRERVAGMLVKRAWQTLGLDQQGAGSVVNVVLMANMPDQEDVRAHVGHTLDVSASVIEVVKDQPSLAPPADPPAGQ